MSVQLTPSKRSPDQSPPENHDRKKLQKVEALVSGSNIIRLLFPESKIASVIGEGSTIISQLLHETGAVVHVEETVEGCDERVIVISIQNETKTSESADETKESNKTSESADETKESNKISELADETKESNKISESADETKQSNNTVDDPLPEKATDTSSIQKALLVLFDKMVDGLSDGDVKDPKSVKLSSSVARLLIFNGEVERLFGKGGGIIQQMSYESGAHIRILPKEQLPSCTSSSDELVQISGGLDSVRKALQSVSRQLLENYLPDQDTFPTENIAPSTHSLGPPPPRQGKFPNRPSHGHGPAYSEPNIAGRMNTPPDFLTFRLLCTDEKVGGVIGKGGSIVKALQHETGCEIKVLERVADSEDRIIVVSGPAHPLDGISPVQDAALRVQARIFCAVPESKDKINIARLLVSSNQIGCLLGKGGSVISEMRKSTGAYIRILGKDQVPICASENEEVIQANGGFEVVQEALLQITANLKNHFFRDAFPPFNHPPPNQEFLDQNPPFAPYNRGRRVFSPPGVFPSRGPPPPFNNFDGPGGGMPPRGGFHPRDDHPPFARDFHGPGMIPPHRSERMPLGTPWGPQGHIDGPGPMGFPEYPGAPQRRFGGFPGGNQPAVITSSTVEVVVPRFVVPAIYGEGGGCVRDIRQFSGAKITITDTKPGSTETTIIISGTPVETNAAQSLIQAFVILETEGKP